MAFSLGVIDLDGFKRINDSLGHPVGDELLRAVAARLRNLMRQGDTLARVGGDEFVLVLPRVGRAADLLQVGRRITAALEAPFAIAGRQLHISASVGFACCPEHAQDPVRLLSQADLALYRAKGTGKNRTVVYDKEWECGEDGLSMESALRAGFAHGEFFPVYQPIVELASGRIVGAEALMRWNRPGHGLVPPASFIPVAESIGLIDALGSWMLRAACVQSADFQQRSDTALFVSVNVSPSQFHTDLVQTVREALALRAMPGTRLRLEITESALMRNPKHSAAMLEQLADLGVRLAVDDFGTGYSSFAYLRDFPLSTLKVDRSFVASLPASKKDAAICTALFALARELGLQCVAEGVETAAQAQFLREQGCPLGQGFFLGQPMTAPQFLAYLDARRQARA
jgi:diguanylate cyclase (GGDEF)-like protein